MSEMLLAGPLRLLRVIRENVRFAWLAVTANKLRSLLTISGIVIGVMSVIAMVGMVEGFQSKVAESISAFGSTLVQFQKFEPEFGGNRLVTDEEQRNRPNLTIEDATALKAYCPSAKAVSPERYLFSGGGGQTVTIKALGREANSPTVAGVWPDYMEANNHFVGDGRFITDADLRHATDVAVIGQDVVQALFPGKDAVGQHIEINGRRYQVVGIFEKKGASFGDSNDNFVMLPLSSFDRQFPWMLRGGRASLNIATVPLHPGVTRQLIEEGTTVLRSRHRLRADQPNDFAVRTAEAALEETSQTLAAIGFVMVFIAGVALLVGGVGVMNIMTVAVTERTREIGVRMALGARRRDIVLQFLSEASTLTAVGGVLGVLAGVGIVALVKAIDFLPATAPAWSIAAGLGVSIAVGLFFGLYPAVRASRLDPIEALRYE